MLRKIASLLFLISLLFTTVQTSPAPSALAQDADGGGVHFDDGIDPEEWYREHEIEHSWTPDYLHLATGDPSLQTEHGVYAWPFDLDLESIGWSMQSYQDYGGTPYFHHGTDMRLTYGTQVFSRSGGQVVNIENYNPGWDLYWEVAVLDPDGYLWQYHHIDVTTIPQNVWDAWYAYQVDPLLGHIDPDTHIGNIIYWPTENFHHIHLNILAAGGVYVNGFEFHVPLPDTDVPEIQDIGLLQNGQIYNGDTIEGDYSLYVRARDLILGDANFYYLPPWRIAFTVDGGPEQLTWQFDTLPGGADRYAYLDDFYVVPPTCGDYDCRDYYIDLGFIPDSQYLFPIYGGEHTVVVTVSDYAGNQASQSYTYTLIGPPAPDQTTERVSVSSEEVQGNDHSWAASMSADGNLVVFWSDATNLVAGDTNEAPDVFVRQRDSGVTTLVSVSSDGTQGNFGSSYPAISAGGRYVAFDSSATNLVADDTNDSVDVFVHDRQTGETVRVSVASDGTQGNQFSVEPSISADGRYVAFESTASNLVPFDMNGSRDIFVHDTQTGETVRVSKASDGTPSNGNSFEKAISADGRYVAFESEASNLVPDDTNSTQDVFVHDLDTGETTRISLASDGTQGNNWSDSPSISADGQLVTFWSSADNLVDGDANGMRDVFLHDRSSGETSLVSVASDGTQGNANSWDSAITADGSLVAFWSESDNLVDGDVNGFNDVFVHDIASGETLLVSLAADGSQGDGDSGSMDFSSDGRVVGFGSDATNLVSGDTNDSHDIFVHDLGGGGDFSISGTVADDLGSPLSGVEIACDCGATVTSGGDGSYTLTGLLTGTYTLTPSFPDYTFTPASRTVSLPPDAVDQDFVGELLTYSLSGQVLDGTGTPLSGVLISTDSGFTATTGLDGSYLFTELLSGTYTLTASLDGYVFTPASRTVSLPPDAVDQDFVGQLLTYSISGRVTLGEDLPLQGVLISAGEGLTATTDSQGYYTLSGLLPGTYTLTASLDGYTFAPFSSVVSLPPDALDVDFTAVLEAIFSWLPLVVK